jgi:uncharacterized lipoprotein YmbA
MKIKAYWAVFAAVLIAATGCSRNGVRQTVRDYYMLDAARGSQAAAKQFDKILIVDKFEVEEGFNTNSLIYRNRDGKIESDYYRRYITDKGVMLSSLTAQWLSESGLFKITATESSGISGNLRLKGVINRMYADMEDADNMQAIMDIKIFLLSSPGREPIYWNQYTLTSPIKESTAQAVIDASNSNVHNFLTKLEDDLKKLDLHTDYASR